jgi:hypothetical protein
MKVDISDVGGAYQIFVAEDNSSVYVRLLSNEVIRTDDENQYTFYQYPRKGLVGVGHHSPGPINPTSTEGNTIMSAPSDSTTDTTPATSYGYALDGRRVSKAGAVNMKYLYDGENVVYELWDDMTVNASTTPVWTLLHS